MSIPTWCKRCWVLTYWLYLGDGLYQCEGCHRIELLTVTVEHE